MQKRNTPLHFSAANGHADIVALLIKSGANVNGENEVSIEKQYTTVMAFIVNYAVIFCDSIVATNLICKHCS